MTDKVHIFFCSAPLQPVPIDIILRMSTLDIIYLFVTLLLGDAQIRNAQGRNILEKGMYDPALYNKSKPVYKYCPMLLFCRPQGEILHVRTRHPQKNT